jgi:hypothetical protein
MAKSTVKPFPSEAQALLNEWYKAKEELARWKPVEWERRSQLIRAIAMPTKLEGVETFDLNAWKLKVNHKMNYSMTNAQGETEQLGAALHTIDPSLPIQLYKWVPEISLTAYRKTLLPLLATNAHLKELSAAAIIIKPGAPEIELIPPEESTNETT